MRRAQLVFVLGNKGEIYLLLLGYFQSVQERFCCR